MNLVRLLDLMMQVKTPASALAIFGVILRSTTNFASLETTPGDCVKIGNTNIGQERTPPAQNKKTRLLSQTGIESIKYY